MKEEAFRAKFWKDRALQRPDSDEDADDDDDDKSERQSVRSVRTARRSTRSTRVSTESRSTTATNKTSTTTVLRRRLDKLEDQLRKERTARLEVEKRLAMMKVDERASEGGSE